MFGISSHAWSLALDATVGLLRHVAILGLHGGLERGQDLIYCKRNNFVYCFGGVVERSWNVRSGFWFLIRVPHPDPEGVGSLSQETERAVLIRVRVLPHY